MLADGYTPGYREKIDPGAGPIDVKVEPLGPPPDDPKRVLRGRVVDGVGKPVVGAIVSARSIKEGDSERYGAIEGLDPYAISDAEGHFRICHTEPVDRIGVEIRAPGFAPRSAALQTGATRRDVLLDPGATVEGRLLRDGKGVAGVVVGIVQTNRGVGQFLGEATIGTDETGRFVFKNVALGFEYAVYGKMASLKDHGATAPRILEIDRPSVEAGNFEVAPGATLAGRVVTTDGKAIPGNIRMVLSAEVAWDSQLVEIGRDGRFSFRNVPTGSYSLVLRVPGYRLSTRNRSRLPSRPGVLEGRVTPDMEELVLELEPGTPQRTRMTREDRQREGRIRAAPLRGVEK